jgi:hypothetical protein
MRGYRNRPVPDGAVTDAALDAMQAEELRSLIRDMLPWFDETLHARFANELVDRAARNASGWVPEGPTDAAVRDVETFAETARRLGHAEPSDVDAFLRQGSYAFLRRDYRAAFRIFRALLIPVGHCDVDLGQREMLDEVLGVDAATCAAQYVVSMYMTSASKRRGGAVLSAIDEMHGVGHFWEPLRELERVAVEPLPDFDDFLAQWRALVEQRVQDDRERRRGFDWNRWLREVAQRMQGLDGLAEVARASRRADDLRAWCRALVEAGDWETALDAYDEAAELVTDGEHDRGEFLDGAALAAQELVRHDLPRRLARAWLEAPSMVRLRRWLGSSTSRKDLLGRVAEALPHCPEQAHRQRALLHVLRGDFASAAELLAFAQGLGWSGDEHPGHLLFPLFVRVLGGAALPDVSVRDHDEPGLSANRKGPRLSTPAVDDLIELAAPQAPSDATTRAAMVRAMRAAAEKRLAGVTENKRRRHYGHAASLALACAQVDESAGGRRWLEAIRDACRRFPALRRELGR